jgi:hypothetical protein
VLLEFIVDASPDYALFKEQCYWFCASITEIIKGHFPCGEFVQEPEYEDRGKYGTFSAPQAEGKRDVICRLFGEWMAQIGMLVEIRLFCEMKHLSSRQ